MIKIKNKSLDFTILYLPNRTLRFKGKQTHEITKEEFKSEAFNNRKEDFRVIEEAKEEETKEEVKETKPIKRKRKPKLEIVKEEKIEEPTVITTDEESEPDKENGSLLVF